MVTVMQVARRDLNLDRKKKKNIRQREGEKKKNPRNIRKGINYYYRVPHEKWET